MRNKLSKQHRVLHIVIMKSMSVNMYNDLSHKTRFMSPYFVIIESLRRHNEQ